MIAALRAVWSFLTRPEDLTEWGIGLALGGAIIFAVRAAFGF